MTDQTSTWIFTFGYDHKHPVTGDSLEDSYVKVHAETWMQARERMCASFGNRWAFQYSNEDTAKVKQYNLREIPFLTPEEFEEAQILDFAQRFVEQLARPLWVYRAANGMCPPNHVIDPASPKGRSALTRRRNAAREIATLVRKFAPDALA